MELANQIQVTANLLNCRSFPSMSAKIIGVIKEKEIHNIITEQGGWGQLENGSWINLSFTVPYEAEKSEEELSNVLGTHKVKRKECLWDIAEFWYGVGKGSRYIEIKNFNNLKSDILCTGMVLKIPK